MVTAATGPRRMPQIKNPALPQTKPSSPYPRMDVTILLSHQVLHLHIH